MGSFPLKQAVWLAVYRQGEIDEAQARQLVWTKVSQGRQESYLVVIAKRGESCFAYLFGWRYMEQEMKPIIVDKVAGGTFQSDGDPSGVLSRYDHQRLNAYGR